MVFEKHFYRPLGMVTALLLTVAAQAAPLKEINWVGCGVSKAAFMQDLSAAYEKKTGIRINIDGGGATRGIREVASGKAHLGGSCRLPLVVRNSDGTYSVDVAEKTVKVIPLGWDALVVITHPNNPISQISEQQLRDVYTGKITNWRELGATNDAPINLYARDGKLSGVERTMRQLIFDNNDQEFTSRATLLPSSGKIEQAIEKDPNGLGVSGISSSRLRHLKMLSLNGTEPSSENLKNGSYKYYRLLFLVAGKQFAETPELRDFVKFATSIEGQKVIEKSGTLPYMRGLRLLNNGLSKSYIQALETIEQAGMYMPGGETPL
jgi:phosphate transport system substrate-binding protein